MGGKFRFEKNAFQVVESNTRENKNSCVGDKNACRVVENGTHENKTGALPKTGGEWKIFCLDARLKSALSHSGAQRSQKKSRASLK